MSNYVRNTLCGCILIIIGLYFGATEIIARLNLFDSAKQNLYNQYHPIDAVWFLQMTILVILPILGGLYGFRLNKKEDWKEMK